MDLSDNSIFSFPKPDKAKYLSAEPFAHGTFKDIFNREFLVQVAAEFPEKTEWWVITTDKISSVAGKENKELGKLTLQKQHKGNELEGQITFTQQFKKMATQISETGPLNYSKKNLGVSDEEILQILEKVKKH
jgi:hypothetical protein